LFVPEDGIVTRRHFLVYDQRFGIICLSLKMGQTSDPETLVINQKMTPGNNPENLSNKTYHIPHITCSVRSETGQHWDEFSTVYRPINMVT
jgi:hypothetical protein